MINKAEAVNIACQWHSVMTWNDPGVAMYAFSSTQKVQSKEHRQNLIDYTNHCLHRADPSDQEDLEDLIEYFTHTEIEEYYNA